MSKSTVDGVERADRLGVKVVIVGAGVGGLLTALECWRKGCDVVVLEKAAEISPLGDFFTIPPSGLASLKEYPTMWNEYHKDVFNCSISIWRPNGTCVMKTMPEWVRAPEDSAAPGAQVSFIIQRPIYTKMLYNQCIRLGIPVLFKQQAASFVENDDSITIETVDGTKYTADVCVAADGVGTSFTRDLAVSKAAVMDSGYAIARAAFPASMIKPGSPAATLLANIKDEPEFRTILGENLHLILFLTHDHVAFAYTHKSDGKSAESWHNLRDPAIFIEQLEEKAKEWDPAIIDFLRQIPGQVVDWGLRWRDPVENWTSEKGRIIAVGDAAHAFLPTAGNGAVQACEDAISLAVCIARGGRENIPWSTRVHNKLRYERVTILQQAGFVNREQLHHSDLDAIASKGNSDVGFFKQGGWVWKHNAGKYAEENYAECLKHLREGTAFVNTNLPPGHTFKPWTMAEENARMAEGRPSNLKNNGYWGI